jgi:hypothetical protein
MATVGYYIRGSSREAADWALMAVDHHYTVKIVVDGLAYEDAVALYWRKLEELQLEKMPRGAVAAGELPLDGDIAPRRRARQLTLKL